VPLQKTAWELEEEERKIDAEQAHIKEDQKLARQTEAQADAPKSGFERLVSQLPTATVLLAAIVTAMGAGVLFIRYSNTSSAAAEGVGAPQQV